MTMGSNHDDGKKHLHDRLVSLGDMMGDGLHLEPGGKWISKEYAQVAKALGYGPLRANNTEAINDSMSRALETARCKKDGCNGELKQTRSGSKRAACVKCGARYQFKTVKRKVRG